LGYLLGTVFGAGLVPKIPGTMGTLAAIPLVGFLAERGWVLSLGCSVVVLGVGTWAASVVGEHSGKHDDQRIVIDEFLGYQITMLGVEFDWQKALVGLILFRLFDIVKPQPVRWVDQKVQSPLGVMLDDVLAGAYAWATLNLLLAIAKGVGP
jgi:phosphatidylglycerophosphatase A